MDSITEELKLCTSTSIINHKNIKRKERLTEGLVKSINLRNKLFKIYKLNPNNEIYKMKYIDYKSLLNSLIKVPTVSCYKNKNRYNNRNNSKDLLNVIKNFT